MSGQIHGRYRSYGTHWIRDRMCVEPVPMFWKIEKYLTVCNLLGISPASDCDLPTFRNPLSVPSSRAGCRVLSTLHPAFEDGTDIGFRNVGKSQSDTGEIPKRIHTIFNTRQKFEIKKYLTPGGIEPRIIQFTTPSLTRLGYPGSPHSIFHADQSVLGFASSERPINSTG
jgi:hypothetical protein